MSSKTARRKGVRSGKRPARTASPENAFEPSRSSGGADQEEVDLDSDNKERRKSERQGPPFALSLILLYPISKALGRFPPFPNRPIAFESAHFRNRIQQYHIPFQ